MNQFVKTRTREVVDLEVDWRGLARAVEAKIMSGVKHDMEFYSGNRGMLAMTLKDAGDHIYVCEDLATGNWKNVQKRLWDMDTLSRDHICNLIAEFAGKDFFALIEK